MATQLVVVSRKADLPRDSALIRDMGEDAKCDFCDALCWINRENLRNLRFKRVVPTLVCVECYTHGEHNRQGYRN